MEACVAVEKIASFAYDACVLQCGTSEKPVDGHCVCKAGSVPRADGTGCIALRLCQRLESLETGDVCLGSKICEDGLVLAIDGKNCVKACAKDQL